MRSMVTLLGGAAVGAAVALLVAPSTGRRTRALIRDKAVKYRHDVSDFVDRKSRHLANKARGYAHKAQGLIGTFGSEVEAHGAGTPAEAIG
jgi:gas vesicle protein